MNKEKQTQINREVIEAHKKMWSDYYAQMPITGYGNGSWHRLRYCNASVLTIDNYYILRSYDTIVACIDRQTGIMYDFLRFVFVYTATSAQHISKFCADYGWGKFKSYNVVKRYYPVG